MGKYQGDNFLNKKLYLCNFEIIGVNMEIESKEIGLNRFVHILKLNEYNEDLVGLINKHLTKICEGVENTDVKRVKKRLLKIISTKSEIMKMGIVAEFFIHLYLNMLNYKQEFLFFNLEDTSMKKGFDGVYSILDEVHIVESKSGSSSSKGISHINKIKEAYTDLKQYFDGTNDKGNNNPWRNAYNHASHSDIKAKDSLRKQMKELANLYDDENYGSINEYSIIPCSTIFLNGVWGEELIEGFSESMGTIGSLEAKKINFIILTKKDMVNFIDFLASGVNND